MAIKTNLLIDQGTDFSVTINVLDNDNEPISLNHFTGAAQMRKYYTSSRYYPFQVQVANGSVTLSMNSTVTGTITPGRYVFDCELTSNTANTIIISRIIEGIATVTPGVTR